MTTEDHPYEVLGVCVGFIGVGHITTAMVRGLSRYDREPLTMLLSPRSSGAAAQLAAVHPDVMVCPTNSAVVEGADVVVIAVRSPQLADALAECVFHQGQTVINLLADVPRERVVMMTGAGPTVVRAIPLPAVERGGSRTVVFPPDPVARRLFERVGSVIEVEDEVQLETLCVVTGTITAHLAYLASISAWATIHGVDERVSEDFVRTQFADLSAGLLDPGTSLPSLLAGHETLGGVNERFRTLWFDVANATKVAEVLELDLSRLAPEQRD